ncbi:MAG: sigma-54-dependent Fis family transcriptional regulator [Sporomusa sp.]|jgi:DNA-binding NtrC family response regulator|nr:sigma-54-dependent Fis family transcriptional regulator [Sporomusa sp.]
MVLIIEDENTIAYSLKIAFTRKGVDAVTACNGKDGLNLFYSVNPAIVILDIKLPDTDGLTILKKMKEENPSVPVIMITYMTEVRLAVKAMKLGAFDYYTKPFSVEEVVDAALKAVKYKKVKETLDDNNLKNSNSFKLVFGKSKAMKKVVDMVTKLAKTHLNVTLLLQGASGVGKDVIARHFHLWKYNSMDKFVAINCAAIPHSLLESELFGFEKGSFTEAKAQKVGLIEKANGGTLFLDEIGDMSLELQAKILRAIQEKSFMRIGGLKEITFEANIISATNKNLEEEISKGGFRADLYYRLSTISIHIPSLKNRQEDIVDMLNHFLIYYNRELGKDIKGYTTEALELLLKYHWPGNIRQLKGCIERAAILSDADFICLDDLPQEIIEDTVQMESAESSRLDQVEIKKIMDVLSDNHWNITKSADALGISRLTLRRKIQKYSLTGSSYQ